MARDIDTGIVKPTPVIFDEQAKAAAMRAAAKGPTPDEAMLANAQTLLARMTANQAAAAAELDAAKPKVETAAERLERIRAERIATQTGNNPDNPKPTEDPGPGMYWANFGGVWRKYKSPETVSTINNPDSPDNPDDPDKPDNPNKIVDTPTKTLVSTEVDDATGDTVGYFSDGSKIVLNKGNGPVRSQEFKDAYALLEATFRDYGLETLVPTIKGYMERDLGPEQAALELRSAPEYIARFKGNQLRLAAGKNALREDIYLATERAYDETLTSYGQANYFGVDRQAKQAKMAEIIGNDISADEFKTRVDLAVTRVTNADPTIKKLLKDFYPSINDADLVGYFLNPAEGLPKLTEKVTSAEIGSAFLGQGLAYTQQRSAELAQYGIDRAGALKGAKEVKEVLPDTQKLGNIYGESGIKYTQQTAEEEFLKDNQDAATKRKRLASMERGSFGGSAGNAPGAYSTGYLKKSSTAGLI